ncbi:hypothetical protein EF294_17700 [Gordonia oryzae]|uniref:ShKT domain-containing protein n=1 Tax=Gordonia oryzae TaxID=2487349 RepID=A0A3N4G8H3_9ACTN|nr:hypothetical protein EF294_17700 [Gordonia oryzae]
MGGAATGGSRYCPSVAIHARFINASCPRTCGRCAP